MAVSRGKLIFDAAFTLGFLVFFAILCVDCARRETVTCDRSLGKPRCIVEFKGLLSSSFTTYDDLTGVRVIDNETRRGGHWYEIALKDREGHEHLVADSIDPEEAKRVEAWFADGTRDVKAVRESYSDTLLILGAFLAAVSVFLLWALVSNWRDWRGRKVP